MLRTKLKGCGIFMDSIKLGKFIAQQRKIKGLTQEEFAEQLNITRALVSRWERGLTFPVIDMIVPICSILDLEIYELFECKRQSSKQPDYNYDTCSDESELNLSLKNKKNEYKDKHNLTTINIIKTYNKQTKKKYIKITISVILCLILFLLGMWISYKYNHYIIEEFNLSEKEIQIDGILFSNKVRNILVIKDINYNDINVGTDKEISAKDVKITLMGDEDILYVISKDNNDTVFLSEFLKNISFYYDFKNSNYNDVYLKIQIKTREDELITINFTLL